MKKSQWLVIGMMAGAALLSACSSTPKAKGNNVQDQNFSDESARTSGMSGADIAVGSPEWRRLASFAEKNKCEMIQAVPGIQQHIFFEFDQSNIPGESMDGINAQAKYLMDHADVRVRVEGNADDRGSREYNIALGMRRANAVAGLLKQAGVSGRQIEVVSFGAEKPMAFGEQETSYRCNRRVDIVYIK